MENRRAVLCPHDLMYRGVNQGDGPRPSPASREDDDGSKRKHRDHSVDRSHTSGTISETYRPAPGRARVVATDDRYRLAGGDRAGWTFDSTGASLA